MPGDDIAQFIQYLAILLDARSSENGAAEMYSDEQVQHGWRCKYCHCPFEHLSIGHYADCVYHTALAWKSRVIIEARQQRKEQ